MTLHKLQTIARQWLAVLALLAVAGSVTSSLRVFPHQLAYFNEAIGGPEHGHRHMLGSSLDWGQGLLSVRDWYTSTRPSEPLVFAYAGSLDPSWLGINSSSPSPFVLRSAVSGGPAPSGWYAVSISCLYGEPYQIGFGKAAMFSRYISGDVLRGLPHPIHRLGGSIILFRVTDASGVPQADSSGPLYCRSSGVTGGG